MIIFTHKTRCLLLFIYLTVIVESRMKGNGSHN